MDDFLNEVVLLTSAKHRNLVKLKGCCLRGNQRLLVYEYMEKYDLADVLFGKCTITIGLRYFSKISFEFCNVCKVYVKQNAQLATL